MSLLRNVLITLAFAVAAAASAQDVPEVRFTVAGFQIEGPNPIGEEAAQSVLAPFKGEYSGLDGMLSAVEALQQAFVDEGFGFYKVVLPPQELSDGEVRLQVVAVLLGLVEVEGNQFFSDENVLRSLPDLVPGQAPNATILARDVAVANHHPSKYLAITMKRSDTPGQVDATVEVEDSKPWHVFAGFNNIGDDRTGDTRLSIGAQHTNLFDRDHVLTASYTTSPGHWSDVKQAGANYEAPIYAWNGWLNLSYVYSDVDSGNVAGVDVSGSGDFFRAAFRQSLPRRGSYRQAWTASIEDRSFDNDAAQGGISLFLNNGKVRSRPLGLRYDGSYRFGTGTVAEFGVQGLVNLGGGGHNDQRSYTLARLGADDSWNALRFDGIITHPMFDGWLARVRMVGQYAGETLIPGEQLGVGGVNTVRGFDERATAGDNGVIFNIEAWTPNLFRSDGPRLLGFVDVGYRELEDPEPFFGEVRDDTLASVGIGARWQYKDSVGVSLDWASVFEKADFSTIDTGNNKLHFRLFVRY